MSEISSRVGVSVMSVASLRPSAQAVVSAPATVELGSALRRADGFASGGVAGQERPKWMNPVPFIR
mgnify:CR=1 FL=1